MTMTEKEICKEYNEAKHKGMQVSILADLNLCEKKEILEILMMNAEDVTPAGPRKPGGENDKVLHIMYKLLDKIEDEIRRQEKRYLNVVESMRKYGRKEAAKCVK